MNFSENSDQAAIFLRKAVPKMIQNKIVPNPYNYTLWYAYYSMNFPELNRELDYILDRFGTCPGSMSEKLFLKYVIGDDEDADSLKEVFQQAVVGIVDSLSESIEATARQSHTFSKALHTNIDALASNVQTGDFSAALHDLTENANGLCQINDAFQGEMSKAQIEIQSLREQLKESKKQANTDSLTGLNNRRVFDSRYLQLIDDGELIEIALIMMDIDKFKMFNDTHGHLMGDQVLKVVGQMLKVECAEPIMAVRFGGEEFAILCPGLSARDAQKIAENLRVKLSSIILSNRRTGEKLPPVTASFGVSVTQGEEVLNQLVERADKALYTAKESGRNRVQVLV